MRRKAPCAACGSRTAVHVAPCPHAPNPMGTLIKGFPIAALKKDQAATLPGAGPGRKDDTGKARWDLLPFGVVSLVVQVMTYGVKKYDANNWQKVLSPDGRYFAALMRHLVAARLKGFDSLDEESGLLNAAHALCCLVFITSRVIGFDRILDVERK